MEKVVLFGSGQNGREALGIYGADRVLCFCDNNPGLIGTSIDGKAVISYDEMKQKYQEDHCKVVVTPTNNYEIIMRLEADHIENYEEYISIKERYVKNKQSLCGTEAQQHDAQLDDYVERARKIDFLEGAEEFRVLVNEVLDKYKKENFILAHYKYGESGFYGNIHALMDFAGIDQKDMELAYFPIVSHHDTIMEFPHVKYLYNTATIFPGCNYRNSIHERKPWAPIFAVGPYISYAKSLYSEQQIIELKRKYGRIASVYLLHTCEGENNKGLQRVLLDQIYEDYKKQYDTLFLSVYWSEMDAELYTHAKKMGFHIVSAGFRFDSDFARRLRTIFELSDLIITDSYATPLTCAIAMNKPIDFTTDKTEMDQFDVTTQSSMRKLIYTEEYFQQEHFCNSMFSNSSRDSLKHLDKLECYLGLRQVKRADEIRAIFEISNQIWEAADGDLLRYDHGVQKTLKVLEEKNDIMRLRLLREALGYGNNL